MSRKRKRAVNDARTHTLPETKRPCTISAYFMGVPVLTDTVVTESQPLAAPALPTNVLALITHTKARCGRLGGLHRRLQVAVFPHTRRAAASLRHQFGSSKGEGLAVETQIEAYCTTGKMPRNRLARHFCKWMRSEQLDFVAAQHEIVDLRAGVATRADFILRRKTGKRSLVLVELKCGYNFKLAKSDGQMRGALASVGNSPRNRCFMQLMWMHHVLRALCRGRLDIEARLVIVNDCRIKAFRNGKEPISNCAHALPNIMAPLSGALYRQTAQQRQG
jgi:hypothetical protein